MKLDSASSNVFIKNVAWNIGGQLAPLLAAIIAMPLLINGLGVDRFGVLTIAWMLIGYFSFFDLGIGRALTQIVSERLATNNAKDIHALIWTGMSLMLLLGLVASIIIGLSSEWLTYSVLNMPDSLRNEAKISLYVLAPTIPIVVVTAALRGILEAKQAFKWINIVRVPQGVLMFLAPVCILPFTNDLAWIFFSLLIVRLTSVIVFFWLSKYLFKEQFKFEINTKEIPHLLKFGSWMSVSNVISPIMVQMDRFAIGAMLSMAAVAYYATPYEMITKVLFIPGAIAGVCFPQFTKLIAEKSLTSAKALYKKSCLYVFLLTFPVIIISFFFADQILYLWLGEALSVESGKVLKILSIGVLINGIAAIPFSFLQGAGRPDITAKLHLLELVFYLPLLFLSIKEFGIIGAAYIWTLRVMVDALALQGIVQRKFKK